MKKKKLKLNLKKDVISNLQALSIIGGYTTNLTDPTACESECGPCPTGPSGCGVCPTDETMTCTC